ncbi:MAG TPA: AAA family ATPase [Candidatus Coprenecus stercoravium]|uniref:AAA family ATPase n=1 Tax=Candidatus Coprenecus stercoravium TaxID=2840735 RepID=A0A9D2K9T9_9BACT|nr:AAA family ATPase [Candidatus Coprenecus stercoravium]
MAVAGYLLGKIREMFPYEPTDGQQCLFETLASFLCVQGEILMVNGYAGTGKTEAIGAAVRAMKACGMRYRLMAPTGRAAKVLSGYTGEKAYTIHKQIYRQKSMDAGGGRFVLDFNKDKGTCYIVDEASLITIDSSGSLFGSGNLLEDLIDYVRQGEGNRLVLVGDNAQLPPVGLERSPALDPSYVGMYGHVDYVLLDKVVRQADTSGILFNATIVRHAVVTGEYDAFPKLETDGFPDVERIGGGDLIEALDDAISRYGIDETVVLCRSNKRANRYNQGIRGTVLSREETLSRGDRLMVVKNCYQFLEQIEELDFIANGDIAELVRISHYEERYGLHFAEAVLAFPDYGDVEITAKVILDTLASETASLSPEQQTALYEGVYADYDNISQKRKRNAAVREDPYYNALQIKYSAAITCHKSQGGQWKCVFVDNAFWQDELSLEDLKWLYTAITRATEKLYLVNFNPKFF